MSSFFTRFSLLPCLPPIRTRSAFLSFSLSSPSSSFSFPQQLHLDHHLSHPTIQRRPIFLRSMASDVSPEPVGVPKSVPARVAHELLQAGHLYLDVRTVEEFSGGHADGARNIPYMVKSGPGMVKNANFLKEVSAVFGKDDEIIVGCLSGKRSFMAATELLSDGFTCITDVEGGYSAWVQSGLPTRQWFCPRGYLPFNF